MDRKVVLCPPSAEVVPRCLVADNTFGLRAQASLRLGALLTLALVVLVGLAGKPHSIQQSP